MLYRTLLVLILSLALAPMARAADCGDRDCGQPHPEAPAELAEFAFLIGQWGCHVKYMNADWKTYSEGDGTWTAYYMLDGLAIQDDFRGAFAPGYIATTFRAYNVHQGRWNGYWLDGLRGVWSQPLVEHEVDEGIALRTRTKARDPQGEPAEVLLQYHFYDIQERSFRWRQKASLDEGKTWIEKTMLIDCKRLEGKASRAR
ncbi:MAG: hypothetical protein AAF657_01875 [Acidobacteriota bacterium]